MSFRFRSGGLTATAASLVFILGAAARWVQPSSAQESLQPPAVLSISGRVEHPQIIREGDLAALPRQRVAVVDDRGKPAAYEGIPVGELLRHAGAPFGKRLKGAQLKLYVIVDAADGYRVVFALPEFDPAFTDRVIILADRRDGHPLTSREAPFRLIVPGEKRHARWVRKVTTLDIEAAK